MSGRPPLRIAVAQPACLPGDVEHNVERHAEIVRGAAARVTLFPELSLSGYELDAVAVAPTDSRLEPLVAACRENNCIALVGAPISERGRDHIAILAIDDGGAAVVYRKIWLGADEAERFSPGEQAAVIDVDGWRVGLAICKDTGIAEHAAATAALGIDVYAAGVVEHASDNHIIAERAQRVAAAHDVWVATASFAGPTGSGYAATAGRSGIWRPDGSAETQLGPTTGLWTTATLADHT